MINLHQAHKFCKDDISKIENYDKAIADTTQMWAIHHRDEIKGLPSGMKVFRSPQELKENGRYFKCPANELIFLSRSEHVILHNRNRSPETLKKKSESYKGRHHSADTIKKMSASHKGHTVSTEVRQRLSAAVKAYWQLKKAE